jgi:CheY-like chemotaxis protein
MRALRVLVAEDDHALRSFYQLALVEQGHAVNAVRNGLEAMQALTADIDLLVTDLAMPIMRGDELLAEVRASPEFHEMPVLVVTAHPGDLGPELRNGKTVVLQKPFELDAFITRVEAVAALRKPPN